MPDLWMDVDAALAEVPVNAFPLIDDTDFKSREESVAYNASGMELLWHFVTPAGAYTVTAVTPTTGGDYDWAHQDGGMYTIEIPASGGASINNNTEGFGWFTGFATGVLPWKGPVIGFRAAGLNDLLIEGSFSATRGLAGTALPAAAADAAGGLPISDSGELDLDAKLANTNEVTAARMGALTDWINGGRLDLLLDAIKAVTDALPDSGALSSLATASALTTVDTVVDAIKAVTDALPDSGALSTIDTNIDTLLTRLSAARAGYLDNLSAGAVATAAALAVVDGIADDILEDTGTTLPATLATIAGYLDTEIAAILLDTGTTLDGKLNTIDTVVDAIKVVTDAIPDGGALTALLADVAAILADTGTDGVALTAAERNSVADALLDRTNAIETGWTLRMALRVVAAAVGGKLSGAGTATNTIRSITDGKDRITATVDADGNRSAITLDGA